MARRYPKMTDEQYASWKLKLSLAKRGKPSWNTGKHLSETHKKNLSDSHKGYVMPEEQKRKIGEGSSNAWKRPEYREKYSKTAKRKLMDGTHSIYQIIKERRKNARIDEYDLRKEEWTKLRKKIKARDNHTCQSCGKKNIVLHCHHIIPYAASKDNSEDNLVSLCPACHSSIEYFTKRALEYKEAGNDKEGESPLVHQEGNFATSL